MKKAIRYGLFALVVYLVSMVVLFPADRAYSLIRDRLGMPVQIYQISGRIWGGHIGMARTAAVSVKDIDWCLHVLPLFIGRVELGLTINAAEQPFRFVIGRHIDGSLYVRDDGQSLPVAGIERLLNPQPFGLSGTLDLDLDDILLTPERLAQVNGTVIWHQAGLGEPVNIAVGDLSANVSTQDDVIQASLKDLGGPLTVDGQLMLMPDSSYRLTMTLVAKDKSRADLKQALNLLGTPSRDGKVTLSRRGRLNLGFR